MPLEPHSLLQWKHRMHLSHHTTPLSPAIPLSNWFPLSPSPPLPLSPPPSLPCGILMHGWFLRRENCFTVLRTLYPDLSVYRPAFVAYINIYLSILLSIYLSICLSSIYLSIVLSLFLSHSIIRDWTFDLVFNYFEIFLFRLRCLGSLPTSTHSALSP